MFGASLLARQKSGIYMFRKRVPDRLRLPLGQTEIKKSLRTGRKSDATVTKHQVAVAVDYLLDHAKQVVAADKDFTFPTGWVTQTLDRLLITPQAEWSHCLGNELEASPASIAEPPRDRWVNPPGMPNVFVPASQFANSPHGLLVRIASAVEGQGRVQASPVKQAVQTGTTLRELYADYLNERKLGAKTEASWQVAFRRFFEVTGLDWESDIGSVTKAHARQFKQAMLRLPRTTLKSCYRGKTTLQIIEMADRADKASRERDGENAILVERVAAKTADRDLSAIAAVLSYAVSDGYLPDNAPNPFAGISVDTSGSGSWRSFTTPQLKAIFSDPIFMEPVWGSNQWMIVLGYATGAREEELGALHVSEIINDRPDGEEPNWYLWITNLHRSLKTDSSRRKVPLHKDVIELGFLDYWGTRKRNDEKHLFDLEEYRGSRTQKWSKWFNGDFLVRNQAKTKVHVFHSWRHTFADLMREARIDNRVQDALVGHKPPGMNSRYGGEQPLSALREAMDRIRLPFLADLLRQRQRRRA